MVDNNITMFGYPTSYYHEDFNKSDDPAFKKLAETYHIAETWADYWVDYKYYIHVKGTHANVYSYLTPPELEMGRWWRSTEHIPAFYPYGGWRARKKWNLNEV